MGALGFPLPSTGQEGGPFRLGAQLVALAKSRKPKAESRKPKAESRKPKQILDQRACSGPGVSPPNGA
jgi:hypothetical protein